MSIPLFQARLLPTRPSRIPLSVRRTALRGAQLLMLLLTTAGQAVADDAAGDAEYVRLVTAAAYIPQPILPDPLPGPGVPGAAVEPVRLVETVESLEPGERAEVRLAVVIDDVGYHDRLDQRIVAWPYPITLAVLPYAPQAWGIARAAQESGKEVILHQPMQPHEPGTRREPGNLTTEMSWGEFETTLRQNLQTVPTPVGLNNHTGSRLTEDPRSMHRLMQHLRQHGLYFLDSRTTPNTVAEAIAMEWGVPTARRDVFLDHIRTPAALAHEFRRALALAERNGQAILIAHPNPLSVNYLDRALAELPDHVRLVTVSELVSLNGPEHPLQPALSEAGG